MNDLTQSRGNGEPLPNGKRLKQALSKLSFCLRVCCDTLSFFKLISNTRKFSRFYKSQRPVVIAGHDQVCQYQLNLAGIRQQTFLRTYSGDIQMFYELFWNEVYAIDLKGKNNLLTIIDAGANIGMASLYFLAKNNTAIVYAIEPDSANFAILKQNLSSASRRVKLIQCALSCMDGTSVLETGGWAYNSSIRSIIRGQEDNSHPIGGSSEIVETKSMQTIINDQGIRKIDLLKIDIEGSEAAVFSSNTEWLHIVENILIEIHDQGLETVISTVLTNHDFEVEKWNKNEFGNVYLARRKMKR